MPKFIRSSTTETAYDAHRALGLPTYGVGDSPRTCVYHFTDRAEAEAMVAHIHSLSRAYNLFQVWTSEEVEAAWAPKAPEQAPAA